MRAATEVLYEALARYRFTERIPTDRPPTSRYEQEDAALARLVEMPPGPWILLLPAHPKEDTPA